MTFKLSEGSKALINNNRFALVFASLLLMFLAEAFGGITLQPLQGAARNVLLFGILVLGLLGIAKTELSRRTLIYSYVVLCGITLFTMDAEQVVYKVASNVAVLFFLFCCSMLTERYLLTRQKVDREVLLAALCGYAILVMLFASAFVLLDTAHGGAFQFADTSPLAQDAATTIGSSSRALYFSLVTITTLGYGDITPVTQDARLFAALEAFVGQLYLAILVARLVGLQLLNQGKD